MDSNAVYVGAELDVQMLLVSDWSGWSTGAVFRDNKFYVDGVARYGHAVKRAEDGTYTMEPGWGGAKEIAFEGNHYAGKHVDCPEGAACANEAGPRPAIDWSAPEFDPAKRDEFDGFLRKHRHWMMQTFERQFGDVKLGR